MMNAVEDHKLARLAKGKYHYLLLAAALAVYVLIVLGGILRVTADGGGCPDWPACFGGWLPPQAGDARLDYLHRFAAFLVAPVILAAALIAWKSYRRAPWVSLPVILSLAVLGAQVALGGVVALSTAGSGWEGTLHLTLSLLIQALLVLPAVLLFYMRCRPAGGEVKLVFRSPFARLTLITLGLTFILMVSGSVVAAAGTTQACSSWPLCSGLALPANPDQWIHTVHRLLVLVTGLVVGFGFFRAWRTQRTQTPILVANTAATVLFFAQALLGAKLVAGFPLHLVLLHEATAVAVWAALVVQAAAAGLAARSAEEERLEAQSAAGRAGLAKDFLLLTKPIVVLLLLVTTFAGMVIGAEAWPSLPLAFWTLLGGFLAAGGSGAINQYIDREDDVRMQRTAKRPIPSGRLTPGEGLAFGVGIALASFYLLTAFVNFLAALLSLAGIFYYVLLYSIFLKKTTVQNIVIGGGAGAIPPLVGWAAATGSLNIPSLFLFAVIFMWTPPHFWALALVRRKDYARAGVPMLPVVRGEAETRWQIFLYTAELVALTLFLPLFGLGGSIYLVGAALLGGWLLLAAWKVWKQGGNKLAFKMYRYSSMYLAFLFLALMIDALL
jgi:protoheme IX farnesyltransferase